MKHIVFYSWQSDLPNNSNRGLIQSALESAAAAISADETVAIEPVIDRDTQGVPGSPDIAATIFGKISAADVFVADVSIVIRPIQGRATPNPNVLIELGYALKALGHERIVLVFNRAFGDITELPFDLRTRRVLVYEVTGDLKEKAPERKRLEGQIDGALRAALSAVPPMLAPARALASLAAIENVQTNRIISIRRDLEQLLQKIEQLEPRKRRDGGTAEELLSALATTQESVAEFLKIAEIVAVMDDLSAASEMYRWFGRIFEHYDLPERFSGSFTHADFDFFKFLGHEMFVGLIAFLLRERRWATLQNLISEPIPMRYVRQQHGPGNVYWNFASRHLPTLMDESRNRQRISLHADLLYERHTTGGLAAILPFEDFVAADYFLFLLGELKPKKVDPHYLEWRAWSALNLEKAPLFLLAAEQTNVAERLAGIFGLSSVAEFKSRLAARGSRVSLLFSGHINYWGFSLNETTIERIATR